MIRICKLLLAAVAAGATMIGASAAEARTCKIPPGIVLNFSGASSGYELLRDGRPVPVKAFIDLEPQDQLRVVARDGRLATGSLSGRVTGVFTAANPSACVRGGQRANPLSNLARIVGDLFTEYRDGGGKAVVARGEFRVGPPDLASGDATIRAGVRRLAFAWSGGVGPFSVSVVDGTGVVFVQEPNLDDRGLSLKAARDIRPGRYTVVIRDAMGAEARGAFTAIAEPVPRGGGSGSDGAVLRALHLLDQGDDRAYDAFLVLMEQVASDEGLSDLADAIVDSKPSAQQ